jgi:hypothetical protein
MVKVPTTATAGLANAVVPTANTRNVASVRLATIRFMVLAFLGLPKAISGSQELLSETSPCCVAPSAGCGAHADALLIPAN